MASTIQVRVDDELKRKFGNRYYDGDKNLFDTGSSCKWISI